MTKCHDDHFELGTLYKCVEYFCLINFHKTPTVVRISIDVPKYSSTWFHNAVSVSILCEKLEFFGSRTSRISISIV